MSLLASEEVAETGVVAEPGFSKFSLLLNWAALRVIAMSGLPHALGLAIEAVVALSLHMPSLILSIFSPLQAKKRSELEFTFLLITMCTQKPKRVSLFNILQQQIV